MSCHDARMLTAAAGDHVVALIATWAIIAPAALVIIAIVASARRGAAILEAVLGGAITVLLVKIAALLYAHPRPFVVHHVLPLVAHAADNAFPSDHAAAAGLAVAFLWTRSRALAGLALLFTLAIDAARVAAQLHWPLDVIAGTSVGIGGGFIGIALVRIAASRTFRKSNTRLAG